MISKIITSETSGMTFVHPKQHYRQQRQRREVCVLLFIAVAEFVSCITSTDAFATGSLAKPFFARSGVKFVTISCSQQRRHHSERKGQRLATNDPNTDAALRQRKNRHEPPSCILKERNPYDVHVYYGNVEEFEASMELRRKMQEAFGDWMRFYNPKDRSIGPHPLPMWEADFGGYEHRHRWTAVRDFLLANNPSDLSILIHPHSLDGDYADHTEHAFWAGSRVLELHIQGWKR